MTVVLCTDVFDQFMEQNNLYGIALSNAPDEDILQHFLRAQLPDSYIADFFTFFDATHGPIAVRSSSLLEDSHYQPFAGIYSTYMIPRLADKQRILLMLAAAIKSVYASVYYRDSKAYMTATSNVIDQEKMAVILQEVVGTDHDGHFYPTLSGVLRSINYYPIGDEKPEEGIASLALGLGKYIVDGGQTLRVSPYHPTQVLQLSDVELALRDTQTRFYALDMRREGTDFQVDDGFNILNLRVRQAEKDGALRYISSTYDVDDQMIHDGFYPGGRKIISFSGLLKNGVFPLPELMQMSLSYGAQAMRRPVEIEMACNINDDRTGDFCLLQIRPIVDTKQEIVEDITAIPDVDCLLRSHNALGNGVSREITDVVYVKYDDAFSAANNPAVVCRYRAHQPIVSRRRPQLCAHWPWPLGLKRSVARCAGEVAGAVGGTHHRGGGTRRLSCGLRAKARISSRTSRRSAWAISRSTLTIRPRVASSIKTSLTACLPSVRLLTCVTCGLDGR